MDYSDPVILRLIRGWAKTEETAEGNERFSGTLSIHDLGINLNYWLEYGIMCSIQLLRLLCVDCIVDAKLIILLLLFCFTADGSVHLRHVP